MNNALMTASSDLDFNNIRKDRDTWGRLVESAAGGHLINKTRGTNAEVFYWRERSHEVDFVLRSGRSTVAIEIKSGRVREAVAGMEAFSKAFKVTRKLLIGGDGVSIEEFLLNPVEYWLS